MKKTTETARSTVKKIEFAGNLFKAGLLKLFLSSVKNEGGETNEK